jgi:hypothetical protein
MTDRSKQFLESIGWKYEDTESAARIIAGIAAEKIEKLEARLKRIDELERWTIIGATELTKNSQHPPFWINAHDLAATKGPGEKG